MKKIYLKNLILLILVLAVFDLQANNIRIAGKSSGFSIKQAVEKAESGDTLLIKSGIYHEAGIVINKPLTIIGETNAIIDARELQQIFLIRSDNVTISGLELRNTPLSYIHDYAAIKLDDVKNCTIRNNIFTNNFFAVYLAKSSACIIENNIISAESEKETASGNGIHLWYCKDITVTNNKVRGHRDGIYFEFVESSNVSGNLSEKNLRYGLHFMFSDSCDYSHNIFKNNGAGVAVMYTSNVNMHDNRFEYNWGSAAYGLLLKEIRDSKIEGNTFFRNSRGIYAESSNRITITGNTFDQNGWAVKIMGNCLDNVFESNNFLGNTFDVATNTRNNFNIFKSNYWDNYGGYDLDRDGVGDVPYRPVSLFSYLVEQNEPSLTLIRSFFVDLLNVAEAIMPILTPETLVDAQPIMRRIP